MINVTFNDGRKKSNVYNVSENGSVFVLTTTLTQTDDFTSDGYAVPLAKDGIGWINGVFTVRVATTILNPQGECYVIDGGVSGRFNYCYFDTLAHQNACDNDPDITCGTETNCNHNNLIGQEHAIVNTASAHYGTSQARVYPDCSQPGVGVENTATSSYYIISNKRARCIGASSYVYEGGYGTNWITYNTGSCSTGTTCVDTQEYTAKDAYINPCQPPPSVQYCSGTIAAIVTDSKSSPLKNLKVYSNGALDGTTDNDGSRTMSYNGVVCGEPQNITIKCSDDTLCDSKSTTIDSNGDYDSLSFACNICINKTDLSIKTSDVTIKSTSTNKFNITALINVEKVNQNNVTVDFRSLNTQSGKVTQNQTKFINVNPYQNQNVSVLWDLNSTDFVSITVDFTNIVAEADESNNYVKKSTRPQIKAYLDISTDYSSLISPIKNYLGQYAEIVSQSQADVNIYVGRKNANIPKESEQKTDNQKWMLTGNLVSFNTKKEGLPYNGIIVKKNNNIYIFGNEIDGDIAALRKLVFNSQFYFSKSVNEKIDYVSEEDLDGLFVFDYLHTDENQAAYRKNNANFGKVVENVLNSNVYSLAIKRVLTTNDNTSLRMKHINAELSPKFREFSNPEPVVLQRGIHSDLFTWEGFGFDLAKGQVAGVKDNKPRDVWLTELVGGPNTECTNCPVYTFDNLSTYYWPALIAGVQKYSNKNNLSYVGFSLGCSVALDSLRKYPNGDPNAGYYNNGSDWIAMSMAAQPIDTFVGIACPGNFTKLSTTWLILNSSKDFVFDYFRQKGQNHTNLDDIAKRFLFPFNNPLPLGGNNMSIEIYSQFFRWINNSDGPHLGKNVSINNVAIFQGTVGRKLSIISSSDANTDSIVANDDLKEICKNVESNNKYYVNFPGLYHFGASALPEDGKVQSLIKKFLDNKLITDSFFDFNSFDLISNKQNCE